MAVENSTTEFNWDDARFFLAAYRAGSYLGAARALAVSHSTVKRRIELLERSVGSRLFATTSGGLLPTDAAQAVFQTAERLEQAAQHFEHRLTGESREVSGSLIVTSVDGISGLLAPVIQTYHECYPAVQLQLYTSDRPLDLRRREADIAVRVTRRPDEDLFGRKICNVGFGAFASVDLINACGTELHAMPWIAWDASAGATLTDDWFQDALPGIEPVIRVTHTTSMIDLAVAGVGAAILPMPLGHQAGLRSLSGEIPELCSEIWCLCHPELRYSDRVRGFMQITGDAFVAETSRAATSLR
ncbi:MAG: LysR family transcriptional regulator [Pseudomonadota bacterium]